MEEPVCLWSRGGQTPLSGSLPVWHRRRYPKAVGVTDAFHACALPVGRTLRPLDTAAKAAR